ncbi:unnamed protein product [Gordionus sp. m RMFG-2023]|uniref:uncharacterized protein LOC135927514 n=1 Tax=Gordionus sp. m RMFG-2023 TaxID=3053472 RepID=UPI0030E31CAE
MGDKKTDNLFPESGYKRHPPLGQTMSWNFNPTFSENKISDFKNTIKRSIETIDPINVVDPDHLHYIDSNDTFSHNLDICDIPSDNLCRNMIENDADITSFNYYNGFEPKDLLPNEKDTFKNVSINELNSNKKIYSRDHMRCIFCVPNSPHKQLNNNSTNINFSINDVPWTLKEVDSILYSSESRFSAYFDTSFDSQPHRKEMDRKSDPKAHYKLTDSVDKLVFASKLSHLMAHLWLNFAKLVKRMSSRFNKCTKLELFYSIKLILPISSLRETCVLACSKALSLYSLSNDNFKMSKSQRAGIKMDVGKFHRWMVEHKLAAFIKEYASVYAASFMEIMCEELCLLMLMNESSFDQFFSISKITNKIISLYSDNENSVNYDNNTPNSEETAFCNQNESAASDNVTCSLESNFQNIGSFNVTGLRIMNLFFSKTPDSTQSDVQSKTFSLFKTNNLYPNDNCTNLLKPTIYEITLDIIVALIMGRPVIPYFCEAYIYSYIHHVNKILNGQLKLCHFDEVSEKQFSLSSTSSNLHKSGPFIFKSFQRQSSPPKRKNKCLTNADQNNNLMMNNIDNKFFDNKEHKSKSFNMKGSFKNILKTNGSLLMPLDKVLSSKECSTFNQTVDNVTEATSFLWLNPNFHGFPRHYYHYQAFSNFNILNNKSLNSRTFDFNHSLNLTGVKHQHTLSSLHVFSRCPHRIPVWTREAIRDFHFIFNSNSVINYAYTREYELLSNIFGVDRPLIPELYDWLRVILTLVEHRDGSHIIPEDVQQASSILLPHSYHSVKPSTLLQFHQELLLSNFNAYNTYNCYNNTCPQSLANNLNNNTDKRQSMLIDLRCRQALAFQMLSSGNPDLVPNVLKLLSQSQTFSSSTNVDKNSCGLLNFSVNNSISSIGNGGNPRNNINNLTINIIDEDAYFEQQTLITPLMYCSVDDNYTMVKTLLAFVLDIDKDVIMTNASCCSHLPSYYSEICHWTALSFSVIFGHLNIVEVLLENGANVEGGIKCGEELCFSETPLQLACASGNLRIVTSLLNKGGDPYLCTAYNHRSSCCLPPSPSPNAANQRHYYGLNVNHNRFQGNSVEYGDALYSETSRRLYETLDLNHHPSAHITPLSSTCGVRAGSHAPFVLAASHGRLDIVRAMLAQPLIPKPRDILSLEEILAEGCSMFTHNRSNNSKCPSPSPSSTSNKGTGEFTITTHNLEKISLEEDSTQSKNSQNSQATIFTFSTSCINPINTPTDLNSIVFSPNFSNMEEINQYSNINHVALTHSTSLNVSSSVTTFPVLNSELKGLDHSNLNLEGPNTAVANRNNVMNVTNSGGTLNAMSNYNNNSGTTGKSKDKSRRHSQPKLNYSKRILSPNITSFINSVNNITNSINKSANDYLTLQEILAEGYIMPSTSDTIEIKETSSNSLQLPSFPVLPENLKSNNKFTSNNSCVASTSLKLKNTNNINSLIVQQPKNLTACNLTKAQGRVLMEAMYHAAESGHIIICMELRNLGIVWNLHIWITCLTHVASQPQPLYTRTSPNLANNFNTNNLLFPQNILHYLLTDFPNVKFDEVNIPEFLEAAFPILLNLFRSYLSNNSTSEQHLDVTDNLEDQNRHNDDNFKTSSEIFKPVCKILSDCYRVGVRTVIEDAMLPPPIPNSPQSVRSTLIDPCYVNSPELSDISFLVEGKIFFGHKIILVNSSPRFKAMLCDKFAESNQDVIPIPDIRYDIFKVIMEFLYSGKVDSIKNRDSAFVLELMAASNFFLLDGLQRECEIFSSNILDLTNCVSIYKTARLYCCEELSNYCVGFFLKNLPHLVQNLDSCTAPSDSFLKLFTTSDFSSEIYTRIKKILIERLLSRLNK